MPIYNWLRIILSIASLISFIPQIQGIISKRSSAGISLAYMLLNTISATEQFAVGFYFIVTHNDDTDFFVSEPRNFGDWLNLAQPTIVWLMFLILQDSQLLLVCLLLSKLSVLTRTSFALCLWYAPSTAPKKRIVALYSSFLLISVVPVLIDFLSPFKDPDEDFWANVVFSFVHTQYVNPLVTCGAIAALYFQWYNAAAAALSQDGLVVQAVVFAIVALSWTARLRFQLEGGEGHEVGPPPGSGLWVVMWLRAWYEFVGWAAVDNGVFALVQAALLYRRRHETGVKLGGE
ncbi:hypothetical protein BKA64DRAFT_702564 [Cadophora sp. MPI-SDFR-AT-0126]|nr:hypothetical protein BKA64DRAFT_702564 [Leotiomycetes sp. MPI-SDFR-AT-0126]